MASVPEVATGASRRRGRWLVLVLALASPVSVAWLIAVYAVDVPRLDDWSLATVLRSGDDASSWARLARQHVESRPLTSRLLVLALAPITGFDVRGWMAASWLAACVVSGCLLGLARATFPGSPRAALWGWAAANALVFGIAQATTWLHGCHVGSYFVLAFLALGLRVSRPGARPLLRVAAAAACAAAASFSLAVGLLAWLLLPVAWGPWVASRRRAGWLWGGAFAAVAALYFWDWAPRSPGDGIALREPHRALLYALVFLGAPFGRAVGEGDAATIASALCGTLLVAGALASGARLARARDRGRFLRAAPWIALAGFGLASAALAAWGRLAYGIESALAPRYVVWSVSLPVALLFLAPVAFEDRRRWRRPALALAAALLLAYGVTSGRALAGAADERRQHLLLKSVVAFSRVAPEYAWLGELFPWPDRLQARAGFLSARGLLHPPLVGSDRVLEIARDPEPNLEAGAIESFRRVSDGVVVVGRAALPERREGADAVLLCAAGEDGEPRVVAVAGVGTARPDGSRPAARGPYPQLEWGVRLDSSRLPAAATVLTAWAYDALTGEAVRLAGEVPLVDAP